MSDVALSRETVEALNIFASGVAASVPHAINGYSVLRELLEADICRAEQPRPFDQDDDEELVARSLPEDLRAAAAIVAAFEGAGPEVEDITRRACEAHPHELLLADDLFGYAAALVRAKRAEAKAEKAKALVAEWREKLIGLQRQAGVEWERGDPNGTGVSIDGSCGALDTCADELEAVLGEG